jgi:hypothetical protein
MVTGRLDQLTYRRLVGRLENAVSRNEYPWSPHWHSEIARLMSQNSRIFRNRDCKGSRLGTLLGAPGGWKILYRSLKEQSAPHRRGAHRCWNHISRMAVTDGESRQRLERKPSLLTMIWMVRLSRNNSPDKRHNFWSRAISTTRRSNSVPSPCF